MRSYPVAKNNMSTGVFFRKVMQLTAIFLAAITSCPNLIQQEIIAMANETLVAEMIYKVQPAQNAIIEAKSKLTSIRAKRKRGGPVNRLIMIKLMSRPIIPFPRVRGLASLSYWEALLPALLLAIEPVLRRWKVSENLCGRTEYRWFSF
jgi:hypothetical protein